MRMLRAVTALSSNKVGFSLSPFLKERVQQYSHAHEMTQNDALRELVTLGLSASPTDELSRLASVRAHREVKVWALTKSSAFFRDLAAEVDRMIGAGVLEAD